MSVVLEQPQIDVSPVRRLWTMADLAALPDMLPTGDAKYELWEGELMFMSPPVDLPGTLQARISGLFLVFGEWEGHGRPFSEVGVVVSRDPDSVFGTDAAFCTTDQLPIQVTSERYLLTVPALVVEVRSKNESRPKMAAKVARYLAAGAQVVWVVDERDRTITIHRAEQEPQVLGVDDTLTAEGIIPGLSFPVNRIFQGLE
jgi:Uma2 family endonuclease